MSYRSLYGLDEMKDSSPQLAKKLRTWLQTHSAASYSASKKGKMHGKALYRAACPTLGAGDWNQTIFRRKEVTLTLDTSVFLLIDGSGSMAQYGSHGTRWYSANMAAYLLLKTIRKQLGIPVCVAAFGEDREGSHMIEICAFGEVLSLEKYQQRATYAEHKLMNQNADGECIEYAYHLLKQQKAKKRVLIVLSDGEPCCYAKGDADQHTKDVVAAIEKSRDVTIAGIGIETTSVKKFYKKHTVLSNSDSASIEKAIFEIVKKEVI